MKIVANEAEELDIMDDPRPRDRVMWNRLKLLLEAELCNEAWGCKLYQMHREGHITLEARRAGDKYHQAILDWRQWQAVDPEEMIPERRQFVYGKIDRTKRKLREFREVIDPFRNPFVDLVIMHEEWPVFDWQKKRVAEALEDLAFFLSKGRTKRQRKA